MPSVLLAESLAVEMGGNEPWPPGAKLYQQYEVEQILLPNNANSLSVQAFLKMCGLDFEIEMRPNAEHMSPSDAYLFAGSLPFLRCGAFVVSDFDHIVSFVNNKEIELTKHLDTSQLGDMRAYISLVNNVLVNAELFVSWCDKTTHEEVTKPRYGSVYPWPLNHVMVWRKQRQVKERLEALGWSQKSLEQVYADVADCCNAFSDRLGSNLYFFNNRPTELDALVFGHLFTILTTPLPDNRLATIIREYGNLVELCQRIEREYFDRKTD